MTIAEAVGMSLREVFGLMAKGEIICTWVPCSERLPDRDKYYLVTVGNVYDNSRIVSFSYFMGNRFIDAENVVAWTPLPEPYKE